MPARPAPPTSPYRPGPSLRALAAGLSLASLAAAGPACMACNDIACGGGFEWTARTEPGVALLPGAYALEITLEGSIYEVECTVAESVRQSECGELVKTSGDADFDVSFDVSQLDEVDWNPDGPAGGFYLTAADHTDADGDFSATRGPTEVHVVVRRDAQPLLDESYDITYERDDAFRGNERCGYCDELELREVTITQ